MNPPVLAGQGSITLGAAMELVRPCVIEEDEARSCVEKRHDFVAAAFGSCSKSREVRHECCGACGLGVNA
jgi:hypothetical protein